MRETNIRKVSAKDPHDKTVTIDRVHKCTFTGIFLPKMTPHETIDELKFELQEVFGAAAVTVTGKGTICLAAPWLVLYKQFDIFARGKLAIPITRGNI